MKTAVTILLLCVAALMSACDSNPYSNGHDKIDPGLSKPGEGGQSAKVYTLDAPVTVDCTEGYTCSFYVRGTVGRETPVIWFDNLPAEAQFDARSGLVTFTPAITTSGGGIARVHVAFVNIRGISDDAVGMQKSVVFVIHMRPAGT